MTKLSIFHDPVLSRDALTIKQIICFASRKPDWPPTDEFWDGIQADLKDACERGELPYSKNPNDSRRRLYYIRLSDLWGFLVNRDQRWQPLRDFCRRWFTARGEKPPVSITPDGPNPTAAPGVDPYQTGLPGRPKIGHLILDEFRKRVEQSTFRLTLAEEARELRKWAAQEHRDAAPVKPRSIENLIRDEHRRAKAAIPQNTPQNTPQN